MIRLRLETDLRVSEPNEDEGLVVRWRVVIVRDHDDEVREDIIGRARALVVHYGEAVNVGAKLEHVMDGDLATLHRALFTDGWLRDDLSFESTNGTALLYIEDLDLSDEWRERLVDLAVVQRLCETLGQGCSVAVLNGNEARRAQEWRRVGFCIEPEVGEPFLVLDLSKCVPHLREGFDRFEVVPTPRHETPGERAEERAREDRN